MNISIGKMKMVIDELQVAEMTYKRQLNAFEKLLYEYQSIDREGNDKRSLRKISEGLNNEYHSIRQLREILAEVVREYEHTEKEIMKSCANAIGNREVFKRIDIEPAQKILNRFNIKIM